MFDLFILFSLSRARSRFTCCAVLFCVRPRRSLLACRRSLRVGARCVSAAAQVLASKGHVAVCGVLARKSVAAWDELGDDAQHTSGALPDGPPPSLVQMWASGARFLGTLAAEEGDLSDKARDELLTCNAHKVVIKAMSPVRQTPTPRSFARGCALLEARFPSVPRLLDSLLARACV